MSHKILITGGTGYLGRRLALAYKSRGSVILTGRNHDQNRAASDFTGCPVVPLDVTHVEAVRDVIAEVRPTLVIHAAASKYVDIAERQPNECIDANVVGSQNVARVAIDRGVGTVIGISTDKAAPPISNTYGLTKALMERLFCALNGKSVTRFGCVRFGNMPWSTGSFLPAWRRMHSGSGEIGSTGPEMTRLFTPVDEAVELVQTLTDHIADLQGKILCGAMKSAQILDFLNVWIAHKGGNWKRLGARPGERQHEHLIGETELPYTEEAVFGGKSHYVITPNRLAPRPLGSVVSSATSPRFSPDELLNIINTPPPDIS